MEGYKSYNVRWKVFLVTNMSSVCRCSADDGASRSASIWWPRQSGHPCPWYQEGFLQEVPLWAFPCRVQVTATSLWSPLSRPRTRNFILKKTVSVSTMFCTWACKEYCILFQPRVELINCVLLWMKISVYSANIKISLKFLRNVQDIPQGPLISIQ